MVSRSLGATWAEVDLGSRILALSILKRYGFWGRIKLRAILFRLLDAGGMPQRGSLLEQTEEAHKAFCSGTVFTGWNLAARLVCNH
jgi:hypothetical protein